MWSTTDLTVHYIQRVHKNLTEFKSTYDIFKDGQFQSQGIPVNVN